MIDSILKSVYCNYRGRVTVYDVHGQKVHDLSGMLDYDKYLEIERRTPEITQFEGLEDYRCIACELKKKKSDTEAELNQFNRSLNHSQPRNISHGNAGGGGLATTNSGYTSQLPRMARVAPRVAPIVNSPLPLPAAGPNTVVNNNSSGVRAKTPSFPSPPTGNQKGELYYNTTDRKLYAWDGNYWIEFAVGSYATTPPPPMNVDVDDDNQPLPEKTNREEYKDKRIENRWWKRIFK